MKYDAKSFYNLAWLQAQIVFNDNACKIMLMGLAGLVMGSDAENFYKILIALFTILPFLIFSPIAGWLADRSAKSRVVQVTLFLQIVVVGVMAVGIFSRHLGICVCAFAMLSTLWAFMSPSKMGVIKEYVGSERIGYAAGIIEMTATLAVLVGGYAGGKLFDYFTVRYAGDGWSGALWTVYLLGAFCVFTALASLCLNRTDPQDVQPFRSSLFYEHFHQLKVVWKERVYRLTSLGIAFFCAIGAVVYLLMVDAGAKMHGGGVGASTQTGIFMATMGVGIILGSVISSLFSRHRVELGLVPMGALVMTGSFICLALLEVGHVLYYVFLMTGGLGGGLFVVPLNAYLQDSAHPRERGRIISGMNVMTNMAQIVGIAIYAGMHFMDVPLEYYFLILMAVTFGVSAYVLWLLPEALLRFVGGVLGRCVYRVKVNGVEHMPREGGVLMICNHVTYIDALVLQIACPRPIRFIMTRELYDLPILRWVFRIVRVIPISPSKAKEAIRIASSHLQAGEVVCIFPEGELTRTGSLNRLQKGFALLVKAAAVPVLPVYLDNLWGSVFSYKDGHAVIKYPSKFRYPVHVEFGALMPPEEVTADRARRALLDLGQRSFQERPELRSHIGRAIIGHLQKEQFRVQLKDAYPRQQMIKAGDLLAASLAFARHLQTHVPEKRVAIILPPGRAGMLANLAVVLAGKVPVNLNFTSGKAALESAVRRAEINSLITVGVFIKKFPEVPVPEKVLDVAEIIKNFPQSRLALWRLAVFFLPGWVLARMLALPSEGNHEEAALLFTSGSSGEPKGVILSHRNLLANVGQFSSMVNMRRSDSVMATLPIFHSFGFLAGIWVPLLRRVTVVTYPSPLEIKVVAAAIQEHKATVFLATPTFLRGYLKKAEPDQLASLRMVIAGAEKLPVDLALAFNEKFEVPVFEGYGLTETSPLLALNAPSPIIEGFNMKNQPTAKQGSVGRLAPGITARIKDPVSGADLSLESSGILWVKGANIFEGYLNDALRTEEVLRDGWFITGDIARFDEDGFLFLEGRLSRFSKIAGEMVPHGVVEEKILVLLREEYGDQAALVVVGVPDSSKGEALMALSTVDMDLTTLRPRLQELGLPNLWIPKKVLKIDSLPVLGTGKLDLKTCQELARKTLESMPTTGTGS